MARSWDRLVALSWVAAITRTVDAYDYEDIVPYYCNVNMDWGPVPERPKTADKLLQVQVFVRHGARTQCASDWCWDGDAQGNFTCDLSYLDNSVDSAWEPLTSSFRTQPLNGRNGISGNCLTGQLVKSGFEMEQNNGARLRKAYVEQEAFLPSTLLDIGRDELEKDIFLRSTNVPRTKQSAMALVSGLYPKDTVNSFLTLRTMDHDMDDMMITKGACSAVSWGEDYFFDGEYEFKQEMQDLCASRNPKKLSNRECFWWVVHLVDCLMSRMCPTVPFEPRNATIQDEFLAEDASFFRHVWKVIDQVQWQYFAAMARLGAVGPLASEILASAEAAARGAEARKLVLFSGHDTGPMEPLYSAFKLRSEPPYWPSFASMVVLEIWNSSTGPLARWISNGEVAAGPMPFEEFRDQVGDVARSAERCDAAPPAALAAAVESKWSADTAGAGYAAALSSTSFSSLQQATCAAVLAGAISASAVVMLIHRVGPQAQLRRQFADDVVTPL